MKDKVTVSTVKVRKDEFDKLMQKAGLEKNFSFESLHSDPAKLAEIKNFAEDFIAQTTRRNKETGGKSRQILGIDETYPYLASSGLIYKSPKAYAGTKQQKEEGRKAYRIEGIKTLSEQIQRLKELDEEQADKITRLANQTLTVLKPSQEFDDLLAELNLKDKSPKLTGKSALSILQYAAALLIAKAELQQGQPYASQKLAIFAIAQFADAYRDFSSKANVNHGINSGMAARFLAGLSRDDKSNIPAKISFEGGELEVTGGLLSHISNRPKTHEGIANEGDVKILIDNDLLNDFLKASDEPNAYKLCADIKELSKARNEDDKIRQSGGYSNSLEAKQAILNLKKLSDRCEKDGFTLTDAFNENSTFAIKGGTTINASDVIEEAEKAKQDLIAAVEKQARSAGASRNVSWATYTLTGKDNTLTKAVKACADAGLSAFDISNAADNAVKDKNNESVGLQKVGKQVDLSLKKAFPEQEQAASR